MQSNKALSQHLRHALHIASMRPERVVHRRKREALLSHLQKTIQYFTKKKSNQSISHRQSCQHHVRRVETVNKVGSERAFLPRHVDGEFVVLIFQNHCLHKRHHRRTTGATIRLRKEEEERTNPTLLTKTKPNKEERELQQPGRQAIRAE